MEEDFDPIKEYGKFKTYKFNVKAKLFIIIIVIYCIIAVVTVFYSFNQILNNNTSSSIYESTDIKNYSSLDEIHYVNGSIIPTLYKYTHYQVGSTAKYRYEDNRLGEKVTTIEITFSENIPEEYLNIYKEALNEEEYYYVTNWEYDEVYVKPENGLNPQTGKI